MAIMYRGGSAQRIYNMGEMSGSGVTGSDGKVDTLN
eukprot:COSAG05_NODE_318_length_11494_cov_485.893813_3_plen_36_part_00